MQGIDGELPFLHVRARARRERIDLVVVASRKPTALVERESRSKLVRFRSSCTRRKAPPLRVRQDPELTAPNSGPPLGLTRRVLGSSRQRLMGMTEGEPSLTPLERTTKQAAICKLGIVTAVPLSWVGRGPNCA